MSLLSLRQTLMSKCILPLLSPYQPRWWYFTVYQLFLITKEEQETQWGRARVTQLENNEVIKKYIDTMNDKRKNCSSFWYFQPETFAAIQSKKEHIDNKFKHGACICLNVKQHCPCKWQKASLCCIHSYIISPIPLQQFCILSTVQ